MSDWNSAAFNWRHALTRPTFSLHPAVVLVFGFVAHGDAIIREGRGVFAAGPALSDEAARIEGVRR